MQDATISTIAQLLFSHQPILNFAGLVAEMDQSLPHAPGEAHHLSWDHDNTAMFDHQGSRITVSYAEDLPGLFPACLTIGVGFNGAAFPEAGFARRQKPITRMIADRIASRHRPDAIYWHKTGQVVTARLVDTLIEDLPDRPDQINHGPQPSPSLDPAELARILDRF